MKPYQQSPHQTGQMPQPEVSGRVALGAVALLVVLLALMGFVSPAEPVSCPAPQAGQVAR